MIEFICKLKHKYGNRNRRGCFQWFFFQQSFVLLFSAVPDASCQLLEPAYALVGHENFLLSSKTYMPLGGIIQDVMSVNIACKL